MLRVSPIFSALFALRQVPCTLREGPGSSGARRRALEAGRSGTTGAAALRGVDTPYPLLAIFTGKRWKNDEHVDL